MTAWFFTGAQKMETNPKEYLSVRDVAELLGCTTRTIWRLAASGQFPRPVRLTPRLPRWRRADVDAHLAALAGKN